MRRLGLSRPMPITRPITQPSSSELAVISTVTSAPRSSWGKPAQTGEKSSSIVQLRGQLTCQRCC
jgi:hypothetical protein